MCIRDSHQQEQQAKDSVWVNKVAICTGIFAAFAAIAALQAKLGNDKVVLGLSGGVDSSVAAVLLHHAIGKNLHCIFVDNGLLRKDEYQSVLDSYQHMGLNIKGCLLYTSITG